MGDDDGEAGDGVGGTRGRHDARRLVGAGCGEGDAAGCGKGGVSLSLKENQKFTCTLQYIEITYVHMSLCC